MYCSFPCQVALNGSSSLVAVLVLFGGRKIPEFMRGLGRGIREFNDAKTNVKKEIEEGISEKDKTAGSS